MILEWYVFMNDSYPIFEVFELVLLICQRICYIKSLSESRVVKPSSPRCLTSRVLVTGNPYRNFQLEETLQKFRRVTSIQLIFEMYRMFFISLSFLLLDYLPRCGRFLTLSTHYHKYPQNIIIYYALLIIIRY